MILGCVIGELWGARRHPGLDGRKLLIVRPYIWYAPAHDSDNLIAVDGIGAGVGEDVVVCLGDAARRRLDGEGAALDAEGKANLPVDAAVLGIVDRVVLAPEVEP